MTQCIVCAVDGSSGSRRAASVAARLARDLDSRALLVHVSRRRVPRLPRLGQTRRRRRMLKAIVEEHCFPDGTQVRLESGGPVEALMAVAEQQNVELVVVGAHGRKGASGPVLGSVSGALMDGAPCPVVVVPPASIAPLDATSLRSVICGVAGSDTDIAVLRLAADLARRLQADLHAVHAYHAGALPADAAGPQRKLNDALDRAGVDARGVVLPLPAPEALDRIATEERGGLVVVGSRRRGELDSVPHGAVPTRLSVEGTTPVVVLPPGARLELGSGHYELTAGVA